MAREIQLAMLPQQYPGFSAGRPAPANPPPIPPSVPSHRPGGGRLFQRAAAGHAQGRIVHLRRDGPRRAVRAGHGDDAGAGGGIAAHRGGPRPIVDTDQPRYARHPATNRHPAVHDRLLPGGRPGNAADHLRQRRASAAVPHPPQHAATWRFSNMPMARPVPRWDCSRTPLIPRPRAAGRGRPGHAFHRRPLRGRRAGPRGFSQDQLMDVVRRHARLHCEELFTELLAKLAILPPAMNSPTTSAWSAWKCRKNFKW